MKISVEAGIAWHLKDTKRYPHPLDSAPFNGGFILNSGDLVEVFTHFVFVSPADISIIVKESQALVTVHNFGWQDRVECSAPPKVYRGRWNLPYIVSYWLQEGSIFKYSKPEYPDYFEVHQI